VNWNDFENAMQRILKPLRDRLFLMAGRAIITAIDDSSKVQSAQLKALFGESMGNVQRFQNFGFTSNPPVGTEAIILSLGGNRENAVIIATDNGNVRVKPLASGESAIYTDDGTLIHLKKGGLVDVIAATKVLISVPNAEFTGNVKITGNLIVIGTSLLTGVVTTVNNLLVGINAIVTGLVQAAGFTGPSGAAMATTVDITTTGNVTGGGTSLSAVKAGFNAHTHNETGTVTGAPTTPL
jgi:phage baseplate assembly protein V